MYNSTRCSVVVVTCRTIDRGSHTNIDFNAGIHTDINISGYWNIKGFKHPTTLSIAEKKGKTSDR